MSTTIIPNIPNDSVFPTMPTFPSIRNTGAVGSAIIAPRQVGGTYPPTPTTVDSKPFVRRPPPLKINKIYFNKKRLADTYRELHTKSGPTILHIWEIPFSCDVDIPVTELTRRIDAAMAKIDSYQAWTIDYSQFIIKATEK